MKKKVGADIGDVVPLSSISSHSFDENNPYHGIWINIGVGEQIIIEKDFAVNPKENRAMKWFVNSNEIKNKIIEARGSEMRVTVETLLDISDRMDQLEEKVNNIIVPDVNHLKETAITNAGDFQKSNFWNVSPHSVTKRKEIIIPNGCGIRFQTPVSSTTEREDCTIGYNSTTDSMDIACPVIYSSTITDKNYDPSTHIAHRIENQFIRSSNRYKFIDYTKPNPKEADIWGYTIDGKETTLSYPIPENGKFMNVHVENDIYLDKPTSTIKRKKGA